MRYCKEILYSEMMRCWCSCPEKLCCAITRSAQDQVGCGLGQPELVGTVLPTAGVGAGWALSSFPTQVILRFCHSEPLPLMMVFQAQE